MTLRAVKTIYLKEMLDMFRDRRSLISMIVVPVLAVPETSFKSRDEKCSGMFRPFELGSPSRLSI